MARLAGLTLAWLVATPAAAVERVVLDYTLVGEFDRPFAYSNCGVSVRAYADATRTVSTGMRLNAASAGPGIAVEGNSADALDEGEALDVLFLDDREGEPVGAREITYVAAEAPGVSDGDAVPAEIAVEAFGPGSVSLGVQVLSGAGERSVSAAFGGAAIENLILEAIDPVRITGLAFTPPPRTTIQVQWERAGAFEREQIELCGVTLTGSNTLATGEETTPGGSGVGVLGGFGGGQPDRTIDSGETLEVAFAELASGIVYRRSTFFYRTIVGGDEFDVAAFGEGDAPLGSTHLLTDEFEVPVSQLFGEVPISRFVIETDAAGQDGQQLGGVYLEAPEPGGVAGALAALGATAALARLAGRKAGS